MQHTNLRVGALDKSKGNSMKERRQNHIQTKTKRKQRPLAHGIAVDWSSGTDLTVFDSGSVVNRSGLGPVSPGSGAFSEGV